jgi:hypothetical protein
MFLETLVKLVVSIGFVLSIVLLNFTIFRIPIKHNDKQIVSIALIVGFANFYFKHVLAVPYFMLIQMFVYMIMLMVLRRYPLLYSLIVSVVGSLCVSIFDVIVTILALRYGVSSIEQMSNYLPHFVLLHAITMALLLVSALIIHKLDLRFSFVIRRFKNKSLNSADVIWGVCLIAAVTILQFASLNISLLSRHGIIIALVSGSLVATLIHAYRQNKKVKIDRFGKGPID